MKRMLCITSCLVFIALCGCESNTTEFLADDSGKAAAIEEAKMTLNKGNYPKAISELEGRYTLPCPDPEIAEILASAYMGSAGIDLTYLIENIDTDGKTYDIIASALNLDLVSEGEGDYITTDSIKLLIEKLEDAQDILTELIACPPGDYNSVIQLGMASAIHFIMKVGIGISDALELTRVPINSIAFNQLFDVDEDWMGELADVKAYLDAHPEIISSLVADLIAVSDAVRELIEVLGADEALSDELNSFLRGFLGIGGRGPVSESDIRSLLTSTRIVTYIQTELLDYEPVSE